MSKNQDLVEIAISGATPRMARLVENHIGDAESEYDFLDGLGPVLLQWGHFKLRRKGTLKDLADAIT